jgi:hypothetical protein
LVSFVSVFGESKRRQQQAQARARRRPFRHKENIGQWEAVSALTTPKQRLHEREILIHKAASALTTPQERLHERELILIQKSSSAITNYSTRAPVSTNERTPPHPQIIQRH